MMIVLSNGKNVNPLTLGPLQGHTYLNKPAGESYKVGSNITNSVL